MKRISKKFMAWGLVLAMLLSVNGISDIASAAVKPVLSAKKVTLTVGKSKTVKVKKAPKNAKVTWSSKNAKIAKVNKKGKITAVTAGNTTVTAKVVYKQKAKKVTKKLTVKVTVKAVSASETPATKEPVTPSVAPDYSVEMTNLTDEHKSANGITTKDNGLMREGLTAAQLMKHMGQGWNLGNTLEACGTAEDTEGFTIKDFELFWNKIMTTQKLFDGLKSYGINSVRIPIAWSNMMSTDGKYTINEDYFNRVEEVMNYALNNEMYVIINIHYDADWWGMFGDKDESIREQAWTKFETMWTQIANRYKEYSDRLIFEAANEELGDRLNDDWRRQDANNKTGTLTEDQQYETTNKINQKFVEIVRSSGGNNTYRHLLISGFNTDIAKTCDSRFVMPTDTVAVNGNTKLSISVHYYSPSTYCIAESAANSWGYLDTWGTDADITEMHDTLDKMSKFTADGYGVIIGEYGVCSANKDGIPQFIKEVMTYSEKLGFAPVMWDTGLWFDRNTGEAKFSDVGEVFNEVTGSKGVINANAEVTGISELSVMPEETLKKLYTWEGSWTRTGGEPAGGYELKSCDEGLNVQSNVAFWQLWVNADWENMTRPCIKIYMADDALSQGADIQIAYTTVADGGNWVGLTNPQTDWIETCMTLSKKNLAANPWIMLSSNKPGATIVKIEIFDAK